MTEHHKRSVWRLAACAAPSKSSLQHCIGLPAPCATGRHRHALSHPLLDKPPLLLFVFSLLKSSLSPYSPRKTQAEGSQGAGQPKIHIPAVPVQKRNWFLVPLHTLLHVWPWRKTQPSDCTVTQETHPGYLSLKRNTRAEKGV